ncbi:hypothetical protein [Pseudoduganella umbonata]|uniref:Uncharacterized protein n=1 Tax=Pseudoduganella umbonata TaxID=864828 RepID=A0A4P8HU10_9BURK|nr:hypothetical protein [Pseudoduganella umbonata]MBB3223818.1 hypothetical protein [Pseudoduganella umbonata]QCP12766.1 hypothetical protein FCL38_21720 [Pseudoduganella umbonata]
MATEQQHGESAPGTAELSSEGAARRRFTRAGVAASGVLLTLHSQPGMAVEVCTTPSGSLSGGLQSFRGPPPTCAGRSPGYWKTHSWPRGCDKNQPYTRLFSCNSLNAKTYGATSQSAILEPKTWDRNGIGRHLIACYLNVQAGLSSFQTVPMLQRIWLEYQTKGYYTPTAGVRWDGRKIVEYLQGTMY